VVNKQPELVIKLDISATFLSFAQKAIKSA